MRKLAFGLLLFWGVSGACFAGLFDDAGTQQKLNQLQQQVRALDGRLGRVESKSLVGLLNETEELKSEVRQLRGQLQVLSHESKATEQRQKDLYADLDSRLRRLEGGGRAAAA
ncbi:MAG TPA: tol-pal system protein, partial [Betaproteobacteria bacterium]|nr:tol-pal system protein [Betaproteobacteria bacterium]